MPGLPWARMDVNFPSHDKVLALVNDPSPKRWQALASLQCAIYWSAGNGTDGHVPAYALPFIHATPATAALCVKYRFWEVDGERGGWAIHNYDQRQQLTLVTDIVRGQKQDAARKGNCRRWHGAACWVDGECTRDAAG